MEIKLKGIDEVIHYEKLENGLEVFLYNKENFHNNYVTFTTKFGSIYNKFYSDEDKKEISVPVGIAHFLEHKVFAQKEDPQPIPFFASNGASSNAFTTFKNTTYLFSGPDNLKENIEFLLDFVQEPYFTEENVEKERGIITQEIHMCDDRPVDILYENIRKSTLFNNPFKESIIGTVENINQITPELLTKCYNSFYNPANMFLVITGNFNKSEVMEVIKSNQSKKTFPDFKKAKNKIKEPDKVRKEKLILYTNTNIPKVAYNIKINRDNLNLDDRKLSIYLYILFNLLFGETSTFYQKMKEEKIITSPLAYNLLNVDTHLILSLLNETEKYEELVKKIEEQLKNIKITKRDFERKRKVLLSNEIFSFENIELINDMIIDNIIFNGKIEDDIIGIINSLSLEELNELIENISFKNKSVVVVSKKE